MPACCGSERPLVVFEIHCWHPASFSEHPAMKKEAKKKKKKQTTCPPNAGDIYDSNHYSLGTSRVPVTLCERCHDVFTDTFKQVTDEESKAWRGPS